MGYLKENCFFSPVTNELLNRLGDFTCKEEPDISNFFKLKAVPAAEEMLSQSYCLYDAKANEMVAAFCVLNASLSMELLTKESKKIINKNIKFEKHRKQYPSTLIGQFVVFDKYRDMHLGNEFMQFVLTWILLNAQSMGNRFAVIDAINHPNVLQFYVNNAFRFLFSTEAEELQAIGKEATAELSTRMMYIDLRLLKQQV